ncbi:MAG: TolC family protein [Deltaproteobacteria bacterium]|nr:TolC family protein [Deltaproteobacteria bacterium]
MLLCSLLLLTTTATTLTLDQAVARAVTAASAADGPQALEIEAARLEDGGLRLDALRLSVEHRSVDHFVTPRIDGNGNAISGLDNIALGADLPLPPLADLVSRSAADLRARASHAELQENAREIAREIRALVVDIAALKRERALLDGALFLGQQRESLLVARLAQGTSTALLVDDAIRDRLGLAADALQIDDDLQKAHADLALLIDSDDDVDDDIELRCQQPLPSEEEILVKARAHDRRQRTLRLVEDVQDREELAASLSYLPWPRRVQATYITRDPTRVDDVRLRVDFELPVFRILESTDEVTALRRRATARERAILEGALTRQVHAAQNAVVERKKMAVLLTLPPPTIAPEDPAEVTELALRRNAAERRRLRAIARCARAVVDVLSLTAD